MLSRLISHFRPNTPSPDLGFVLLIFGTFLILLGTFAFIRRGVWWLQDKHDEEDITHLRFK